MDSWGLEDEEELVQETFRHFTRDELEKIEQRIFDKKLSDKKKKDRQKKNVEVRSILGNLGLDVLRFHFSLDPDLESESPKG